MAQSKSPVKCECGYIEWVTLSAADSHVKCSLCDSDIPVPPSTKLSVNPASGVARFEALISRIRDATSPFDRTCQTCSSTNSEFVFLVKLEVTFADKDKWPSKDSRPHSAKIPFFFCSPCARAFKRSIRFGFLDIIFSNLMKTLALILVFIIVSMVAWVLPLIGIPFVLLFMEGIYELMPGTQSNAVLFRHLNRIYGLDHIIKDARYFSLESLGWQSTNKSSQTQ